MGKTYEVMNKGSRKAYEITIKAKNGAVEQLIILDHIEQFAESFRRYNTELQDALVTLIKTYRARNEKIRNSLSPSYFKIYPFFDNNSELPLTRLKEDREKAEKIGAYLKAIEGSSNEFIKNLRQQNEEIIKAIENFIMKIEDKADVDASEHFESRTSYKPR